MLSSVFDFKNVPRPGSPGTCHPGPVLLQLKTVEMETTRSVRRIIVEIRKLILRPAQLLLLALDELDESESRVGAEALQEPPPVFS